MAKKQRRGFAAMSREKQAEIAAKGGKAAHEKGTAHTWTSETAREAGRKGGINNAKKYESKRDASGGDSSSSPLP